MNVANTTLDYVRGFFEGIEREVQSDIPASTRAALEAYYIPAGLLTTWRRPYFFQHYTEPVARALQFLVLDQPAYRPPVIMDLGCGLGTQSLIFAAHGARVIAFDLDDAALAGLTDRKVWYERKLGRSLDITPVYGNALEYNLRSLGPIHGVFSLFAFNMMQPSEQLLDRLQSHLAPAGRLAIQDGNGSALYSALPWRRRPALKPAEFGRALTQRDFTLAYHRATGCVPPLACRLLPGALAGHLVHSLNSFWLAGISHQILAQKNPERLISQ